ncbi:DgyrCDS10832 [Dimorphilus gyrociliatus]|uniref:DgyrCDS10832 n=1 Tax=Dimorphilus gyrociliatus TaxID=2664684 RepID=A0A7I8W1F4_9ANNE|nr:DgyrCDS10832 [Dimorphilus gyrociliatus]
MSAYERVDLQVATDSSEEESIESTERNETPLVRDSTTTNYHIATPPKDLIRIQWSRNSGIALTLIGGISTLIGLSEIVIIPNIENGLKSSLITISRYNAFGMILWCGILLFLVGCFGLRAAVTKTKTGVQRFTIIIFLVIPFLLFGILALIISFSKKWTVHSSYKDGSAMFPVHLTGFLVVILGSSLILLAFLQLYEDVCFGELQLFKRILHCCLPCLCPRATTFKELAQDDNHERPPNLLV